MFGNKVDLNISGNYNLGVHRSLSIMFRPCSPVQGNGTCSIQNITNKTQLEEKFNESKKYVGEAQIHMWVNYE